MQPFKIIGDLKCKICKNYMTTENYAIQLKCGNTLCLKCYENMIKTNAKCPFNEFHDHINEPKIRKDELQLIKKINLTIFMVNVLELKKLILDLTILSRDT